ncbi:MAG: hypothetical protein HYV03_06165, partial [Deltaproteobacteria bacterium]|nr:hypothetical protein [Deltaproteobacteria bacterium]
TVQAEESYWSRALNGESIIVSEIPIIVRETWKGGPNETITILNLGGRVGATEHRYSVSPVFTAGESLLLFLTRTRSGKYVVWKRRTGKLHLQEQLIKQFNLPLIHARELVSGLLTTGER